MKMYWGLLGVLVLGACSPPHHVRQPYGNKGNYRPSAYQVAPGEQVVTFGEWRVVGKCEVRADTADFNIKTNGLVYKGALRLELDFPTGTVGTPFLQVTGKQGILLISGENTHYTALLPYTADDANYLTGNDIYLSVAYRTTLSRAVLENTVAMAGLPYATDKRMELCH